MGIFSTGLNALRRNSAGNVLPMAAAGILVSAALVGGGIDMSRAYRVENRLQSACDAGALAGRKAVSTNGFDTNAENLADDYFDANFDEASMEANGTQADFTSDDNGNTIDGTASTTLKMDVMQIFGFQQFSLSVDCSASMGVGNSDVVLVLDTTGSMGSTLSGSYQTRIQALRDAMKNFFDTLELATGGTNARIRYGFVPYSSSVNVGHLLYDLDPDYLVDSWPIQSRQAVYVEWGTPVSSSDTGYSSESYKNAQKYSNTQYNSNNSCNNNLPPAQNWSNSGSSSTDESTSINGAGQQVVTTTVKQKQIRDDYYCSKSGNRYYIYVRDASRYKYDYTYETSDPSYNVTGAGEFHHWDYKQVTYDVSSYKAFSTVSINVGGGSSGPAYGVSSTWEGCIEERSTVSEASFAFSTLDGITPAGALDLDIDTAPGASDSTKWAPMWPEAAYRRTSSTSGSKASSYCPQQARLLAEMTEGEFDSYADSLSPEGNTYLDLGMIWGGRISSPTGIFATNVNESPSNGGEVSRHVIFMTDGFMEPSTTVQSAYGIEQHDQRVTDDGSTNQASRHSSRFRAVCQAIKAKGIRVWVIAFTSSLSTDLTTCASDNSSFLANSADDLNEAFQEIANQVGELRIVQ